MTVSGNLDEVNHPGAPRAVALIGNTLYVGGFEVMADGDYQAFLARVETGASGNVLATWRWDASPLLDTVLDVVTDGQTLYVALATEIETDGSNATPTIVALPKDFTNSSQPLWSVEPGGMAAPWKLALDPSTSSALYVAGQGVSGGWVARCTTDGVCP